MVARDEPRRDVGLAEGFNDIPAHLFSEGGAHVSPVEEIPGYHEDVGVLRDGVLSGPNEVRVEIERPGRDARLGVQAIGKVHTFVNVGDRDETAHPAALPGRIAYILEGEVIESTLPRFRRLRPLRSGSRSAGTPYEPDRPPPRGPRYGRDSTQDPLLRSDQIPHEQRGRPEKAVGGAYRDGQPPDELAREGPIRHPWRRGERRGCPGGGLRCLSRGERRRLAPDEGQEVPNPSDLLHVAGPGGQEGAELGLDRLGNVATRRARIRLSWP